MGTRLCLRTIAGALPGQIEGNRRFAIHVPLPKPTLDDFGVVRIQRSYPTPVSIPPRMPTCRISGRPSRARGRLFRTLPSRWHRCSVSIWLIGKERSRDPVFQVSAGEEARARRWPPVNGARFEVDRFGTPKRIIAMLSAALPCVVVAGSLVIPSNARDRWPERAPGRLLRTHSGCDFRQQRLRRASHDNWYLIVPFAQLPRTSVIWHKFLYTAPIACPRFGLVF